MWPSYAGASRRLKELVCALVYITGNPLYLSVWCNMWWDRVEKIAEPVHGAVLMALQERLCPEPVYKIILLPGDAINKYRQSESTVVFYGITQVLCLTIGDGLLTGFRGKVVFHLSDPACFEQVAAYVRERFA